MELAIKYINRNSGKIELEKVPGNKMLRYLYHTSMGRLSLYTLVKRKLFTAALGCLIDMKFSLKWVPGFIANHQLDTNEFLKDSKDFTSFNDFFYRKLKHGNRPIQDGLVSPADGKILAFEKMGHASKFFVKGNKFGIKDFLKDERLAAKYRGGSFAIIRLAPSDYHRFHFPAAGLAGETRPIKGHYYSVSPMALKKSIKIFCQNKREYCLLDTPEMGHILICEVGATMVGSILQTYKPDTLVEKGEEKGYFAFGGSTVVLLFEPGKVNIDPDLLKNTENGFETKVQMGEKIGSPA